MQGVSRYWKVLRQYGNARMSRWKKDGSATVSDNGRGVPVDMHQKGISAARLVYTTLHAGENLMIQHIRPVEDCMESDLQS